GTTGEIEALDVGRSERCAREAVTVGGGNRRRAHVRVVVQVGRRTPRRPLELVAGRDDQYWDSGWPRLWRGRRLGYWAQHASCHSSQHDPPGTAGRWHLGSGTRPGKHPMTPLAAVVGGLLAGVVGTVCLDTIGYLRYRHGGGNKRPLEWEFG